LEKKVLVKSGKSECDIGEIKCEGSVGKTKSKGYGPYKCFEGAVVGVRQTKCKDRIGFEKVGSFTSPFSVYLLDEIRERVIQIIRNGFVDFLLVHQFIFDSVHFLLQFLDGTFSKLSSAFRQL